MEKKWPHCNFVNEPCKRETCDYYGNKPRTIDEIRSLYPIKDLYTKGWCFKYNRRVVPT